MNITLYSNGCPNCERLEEMLNKSNKEYKIVTDVNVLKEKGIDKVPALEIMYSYKEAYNMILRGEI